MILRDDDPDTTMMLAEIIPMRFKSTKKFNAALREWSKKQLTERSELIVVDHNTGYRSLFHSYDKDHPNAKGQEKIAQKWFDALSGVLDTKR